MRDIFYVHYREPCDADYCEHQLWPHSISGVPLDDAGSECAEIVQSRAVAFKPLAAAERYRIVYLDWCVGRVRKCPLSFVQLPPRRSLNLYQGAVYSELEAARTGRDRAAALAEVARLNQAEWEHRRYPGSRSTRIAHWFAAIELGEPVACGLSLASIARSGIGVLEEGRSCPVRVVRPYRVR